MGGGFNALWPVSQPALWAGLPNYVVGRSPELCCGPVSRPAHVRRDGQGLPLRVIYAALTGSAQQ